MTTHADEVFAVADGYDDQQFAARMTNVQFKAIACRLTHAEVIGDLQSLLRTRQVKRGAGCEPKAVARLLRNGWSTEYLLRHNAETLGGDALRHSLHWAFPQAYYAVFAVTQAYFRSVGFTESSHAGTIRKFGMEVIAGKYPAAVSFAASGARPQVLHGLSCGELRSSIHFDPEDRGTVDGQIAQFLRATREIDLKEKKATTRLTTKRGTRRRAFGVADWKLVSHGLGPTSLLSLLYRKRIKANYRDIDTFLHEDLEPVDLYGALVQTVGALAFIHEGLIAKALGFDALSSALVGVPVSIAKHPRRRQKTLGRWFT